MRTLALLAAFLLVALQAHAEPLPVRAGEVVDQQQLAEKDLEVAMYMKEQENPALQAFDAKPGRDCICRRGWFCPGPRRFRGYCGFGVARCCS